MEDKLTIGAAARWVGVTPKTLRHYEAVGLLPPAPRGSNGYRRYGTDDLNRLGFIRRAKKLGLSLEEVRALVTVAEGGRCDLTKAELRQLLDRKIADCTQCIDVLAAFRSTLEAAARQLAPAESASETCCPDCARFAPRCGCLPSPT